MARVALPESKVRAKRRKRRIAGVTVSVIALLLVLGGFVWLSHAPFLTISEVQVSGEQTVSAAAVTEFVQQKLSGSYLHLFSKSNIFLYPQSKIRRELPLHMPTVASAEVHAVNFHTIEVSIVERQPKALWCPGSGEDDQNTASEGCLLLDQGGAAYSPVNNGFIVEGQDAGSGYKKYYGALHGSTTPEQYLASEQFTSLGALVDAIAQNQPDEKMMSVRVDQNNDVRIAFMSGFELLFELSADGGDVYQRFILALQSDAFVGHTIADFQYLDLRFGDRLYYKIRE